MRKIGPVLCTGGSGLTLVRTEKRQFRSGERMVRTALRHFRSAATHSRSVERLFRSALGLDRTKLPLFVAALPLFRSNERKSVPSERRAELLGRSTHLKRSNSKIAEGLFSVAVCFCWPPTWFRALAQA
jgi:hypothetical protein